MTWQRDTAGTCWRLGAYSLTRADIGDGPWHEPTWLWQLMVTEGRVCRVVAEVGTTRGPGGHEIARKWADGLIAERAQ